MSEEWFETLSEQEKQALVRHELMHLKQGHTIKKQQFGILVIVGALILSALANKSASITLSFPWLLLLRKYSRSCEKEADIEAAKTMLDKQGLINLFENMKAEIENPESKFRIKRFISNLLKPISKLFGTHPEFDERIDYIKNLG